MTKTAQEMNYQYYMNVNIDKFSGAVKQPKNLAGLF